MIVGVLTTYHTRHTWDRSICFFLFNRTTLQVFVTYLIVALYVWFHKHQHDNRVRSKLSVACQWWWFQWRFWFVPSVPVYLREQEEHKPDPWRNPIERNHMGLQLENEVYCVWQVVKTPKIIFNNPVFLLYMYNNVLLSMPRSKEVSFTLNFFKKILYGWIISAKCTRCHPTSFTFTYLS